MLIFFNFNALKFLFIVLDQAIFFDVCNFEGLLSYLQFLIFPYQENLPNSLLSEAYF